MVSAGYGVAHFQRRHARGGRPIRLPFARALRIPAFTRSAINVRSNSAMAPMIWNMSQPRDYRWREILILRLAIPTASNSAQGVDQSARASTRDRVQLDQDGIGARMSSTIRRFSAGRDSFAPEIP